MLSRRSRSLFQSALLALAIVLSGDARLEAEQPPRPADEEFVPIDQLPPDEKLPAAPFVIAAYSIAWIVLAGYLWSIKQRLGRLEREIAEATRRVQSDAAQARGAGSAGGVAQARSREGGQP